MFGLLKIVFLRWKIDLMRIRQESAKALNYRLFFSA